MVNTFNDLKREVALRLRNTLHEREINMMQDVKPTLPHMLGITPIGKAHDVTNEEHTLMDTAHPFWGSYEMDIKTKREATDQLENAVKALLRDDVFRKHYPYPDDSLKSDVIRCEVDKLQPVTNDMKTTCANCRSTLTASPNLVEESGYYYLRFSLDCDECDFSRVLRQNLNRA